MKSIFLLLVAVSLTFSSCKKFLDEKPSQKLTVPTSLNDFQALLDVDENTTNSTPGMLDLGSDEYYLLGSTFLSYEIRIRNIYRWNSEIWSGLNDFGEWSKPYSIIYITNVVNEGLDKYLENINVDPVAANKIKGHALFIRALMHYFLEETFGQPYKPLSANSDLGVPLKLTANLADVSVRSSVQKVYQQIVSDLLQAAELLPDQNTPRNRPSKAAAFAMLARVYLTMQDYSNAKTFADRSLQINNQLQDYNLPPLGAAAASATNPFLGPPNDFAEVLYPSYSISWGVIRQTTSIADSTLYKLFDNNDWRKTILFRLITPANTPFFKGYYSGSTLRAFGGPAVNEMYLVRAECHARAGNKDAALADLNALLAKRWKTGFFNFVQATDAEDALRKILVERRKELIFRGLRWIDLRRLNQDPRFAVTLTRVINGEVYTLPPNDNRYTYPIPDAEIRLSGIQQNPR